MDQDPTTEQLRIVQAQREAEETERAEQADLSTEEHAAIRRADKAGYLRKKLEEQQAADEQTG